MSEKIPIASRRDFLKLAGAASLASFLAACGGAPAPTAPPAATQVPAVPATEPTKAAAPAAGAVTIRFGRHDPVDGDLENVKTFEAMYPNIKVQQEQIADFAVKVPALVAAGVGRITVIDDHGAALYDSSPVETPVELADSASVRAVLGGQIVRIVGQTR